MFVFSYHEFSQITNDFMFLFEWFFPFSINPVSLSGCKPDLECNMIFSLQWEIKCLWAFVQRSYFNPFDKALLMSHYSRRHFIRATIRKFCIRNDFSSSRKYWSAPLDFFFTVDLFYILQMKFSNVNSLSVRLHCMYPTDCFQRMW